MSTVLSRRSFLTGLSLAGVSALAACAQVPKELGAEPSLAPLAPGLQPQPAVAEPVAVVEPAANASDYARMYAAVTDGDFKLPAIRHEAVDAKYLRQLVDDPTGEAPGTLVVNTKEKHLYLVLKDGKAMRYGVGLGRQGYSWKGRAVVQWKRKWPTWTPPSAMIGRKPELEKWRTGMPPGLQNPLGARALYIYKDGADTLYRIHGSPEWRTIGKSASSGCVRMFNQDVIDLYDRVPSKTTLVVI
ncbi:L,D-transpeptidase [Kaistia sp. UC242_56]|uniref:L,D-transpeptidase n=1 Tax=Kaistia sp. UC242_56 TaxID=3374625 RepID=UPI0037ADD878